MNVQLSFLPAWLIKTKLQPPSLRADCIDRPHLLAALYAALFSHSLTLLSAPAGYGKTTLLCQLGDPSTAARLSIIPKDRDSMLWRRMAWLTLDEGDNDPVLFLHYLLAALRTVVPDCGNAAGAVLSEFVGSGVQVQQVIAALVNDLLESEPAPFVLVLDDLHRIAEAAVFALLDYLLTHLPPPMHIVIATRADPPLSLARLRARGQLAELRLADLRFTDDETARFLNGALGLELSPADLETLYRCTEGWAAGLRLLAGSLDRFVTADERTAFVTALAHTDRYVFEFLADEVLDRQPPEVRRFLLQTSILPELTPALCDAVTGRSDSATALEDLERRNLFLVPLSSPPTPIYRYHALFAEFLQQRLRREMPGQVRELHRRAAQYHQRDHPRQAIEHYLAAEMWEEAAQVIEQAGRPLLRQGMLDTLNSWLQALPSATVEAHPHLLYLLGICAWSKGEMVTAQRVLEKAVQGFEAVGDEVGQGEALADMANCALFQADFDSSLDLFNRALDHPLPIHSRIQALMGRAGLMLVRSEWFRALADFEAAEKLATSGADPNLLRLPLVRLSPIYAFLPGGMRRMEHVCRLARELVGEQVSPLRVIVEEYTALLHLWQGRPAEAARVGELALALQERLGGVAPFVGMDAAAIVLDAYVALGDYAAAERYIEPMLHRLERSPLAETMMAAFLFEVGRVYWLQGRLGEAQEVYARMCAAENPREWPMAAGFRARMKGMLALSDGNYTDAERLFQEAVAIENKDRVSLLWGSARVILAYLYLLRGHHDKALATVEPLLAESERRGIFSMVLTNRYTAIPVLRLAAEKGKHTSFAAHLLDVLKAGSEPRPVPIPETGETLTRREVEVLRLIAQGLSNRAIAERLVIGEGTVKSHVHRILRKLDAASRTEAVARARELLPFIFR